MDGGSDIGAAAEVRPRRIRLLGGDVDLLTAGDVLAFTAGRIARGRGALVANHNLHSLHLIRRNAAMRAFYDHADLIQIDSTPMVAWARLLGLPVRQQHRCTYLDWRDAFWTRAALEGWRVFYLGGAPAVADRAAATLSRRHPGAIIETRHGYFDRDPASPDARQVVEQIRGFAPDILFVGMGMPIQEAWISDHRAALPPCVIFPIGAAFDYEAGVVPTPPRWTGRLGVEWLARFVVEPRRLFTRYFVEPWSLIGPAVDDLKQHRSSGRRA